jgi:glycosyltransferase involved in cell wall biosynthesis
MQPKVSVIIPVYNTASYLRDTVDSIRNQTLHEIEIIILNDGSTDNSLDIIKEYAALDNRIQYYSQPNQGIAVTRTNALKYTNGRYLYFIDSDDILEDKRALQECFELCENEKLDFVCFDAIQKQEIEKQNSNIPNYTRGDKIENKIWNGKDLLEYELIHKLLRTPVWLYFINRSFLTAFFKRFIPGIIHEDNSYVIQIHLNAKCVRYISKSYITRRVRQNSIMTNKFSMRNIEGYTAGCIEIQDLIQNHPEWKTVIDLYLHNTLNDVIWAGHRMTFLEKVETFCRFHRLSLNKYITLRNWVVFWLKRK